MKIQTVSFKARRHKTISDTRLYSTPVRYQNTGDIEFEVYNVDGKTTLKIRLTPEDLAFIDKARS